MNLKKQRAVLLLVDIQKGMEEEEYYGGNRCNPKAEENCSKLLNIWRSEGLPIIHIQHSSTNPDSPLHPSSPGFEIKDEVYPKDNEPVIVKHVNSAFINTQLQSRLDIIKAKVLVVVGLTTNHCISTTVRMAGNLGYDTYVVSDATACFNSTGKNGKIYPSDLVHQVALSSLHQEFAEVVNTAEVTNMI